MTAACDDLDASRGDAKDAEYRAIRAYRDARDELARMEAEVAEASTRDSNVPIEDAQLRGRIADVLGLAPTDLPYAAELIAVADDAPQWEAAAERSKRDRPSASARAATSAGQSVIRRRGSGSERPSPGRSTATTRMFSSSAAPAGHILHSVAQLGVPGI